VRLFVAERDSLPPPPPNLLGQPGLFDPATAGPLGGGEPAAADTQRGVEGFVLLDPLWRGGEVFGYVTSLNRMRRDGHHGGRRSLGKAGVQVRDGGMLREHVPHGQ
jgi:hypothetical protein